MNVTKNILFAIAAVSFMTAATMVQVIAAGVKGVLPFLIDTFGLDAGMWIACDGAEAATTVAAVATIAACIITGLKK
jgi:hypothetical protein